MNKPTILVFHPNTIYDMVGKAGHAPHPFNKITFHCTTSFMESDTMEVYMPEKRKFWMAPLASKAIPVFTPDLDRPLFFEELVKSLSITEFDSIELSISLEQGHRPIMKISGMKLGKTVVLPLTNKSLWNVSKPLVDVYRYDNPKIGYASEYPFAISLEDYYSVEADFV